MPDKTAAVCAACSLLLAGLGRIIEQETLPAAAERQSSKPQTRRWLEDRHRVAVRAAVEDELELVCGRYALRSVQDECNTLIEEHEDELVRGAMDGEDELCSALLTSCDSAQRSAAATAHAPSTRSEEAPSASEPVADVDGGGWVVKLVAHTFEEAVLGRSTGTVLVLLFHSRDEPAAEPAEPVEAAYAEAWREFHKLARQLGGKVRRHRRRACRPRRRPCRRPRARRRRHHHHSGPRALLCLSRPAAQRGPCATSGAAAAAAGALPRGAQGGAPPHPASRRRAVRRRSRRRRQLPPRPRPGCALAPPLAAAASLALRSLLPPPSSTHPSALLPPCALRPPPFAGGRTPTQRRSARRLSRLC